jgi:hypothetical protein
MTGSHLAASGGESASAQILFIIGVAAAVAAYWLPVVIASRRHVRDLGTVIVVNLFAGWTLIGWVIALALAVRDVPPAAEKAPAGKWPWYRYLW